MAAETVPFYGLVAARDGRPSVLGKIVRIVSGTGDARVVLIDVAVANAGGSVAGRMTMVRPPMAAPPVGVSAS